MSEAMSESKAVRTVVLSNPEGLHARAATEVRKLVMQFDSDVVLVKGDLRAAATEVLQTLSLGAGQGEPLQLEAVGSDAEETLDCLVKLFQSDFQPENNESR